MPKDVMGTWAVDCEIWGHMTRVQPSENPLSMERIEKKKEDDKLNIIFFHEYQENMNC